MALAASAALMPLTAGCGASQQQSPISNVKISENNHGITLGSARRAVAKISG